MASNSLPLGVEGLGKRYGGDHKDPLGSAVMGTGSTAGGSALSLQQEGAPRHVGPKAGAHSAGAAMQIDLQCFQRLSGGLKLGRPADTTAPCQSPWFHTDRTVQPAPFLCQAGPTLPWILSCRLGCSLWRRPEASASEAKSMSREGVTAPSKAARHAYIRGHLAWGLRSAALPQQLLCRDMRGA